MTDAPLLPGFLSRVRALELASEAAAAETRRCAALARRAYEANKEHRPKAAEIARRLLQEIENGDPGF